jgi:hypothetical protein
MGGMPVVSNPMHAVSAHPLDRNGGCPNDGNLHVTPCRIRFDANHSGPVDVTISNGGGNDRRRQTVKESDDCTSRNIATLTRDSNHVYTVTAGTSSGSCTANFTENDRHNRDGDRGQNGNLRIVNQL